MGAPVPVLEMVGVEKSFLSTKALAGVDFDCLPGEVHALVGENGAGKSTLMKVLAGVHQPDKGEIRIGGKPVHFHHPAEAQHAGVSIIFQEFNLLPERTVAQNIFVGREPRGSLGRVDSREMEAETAALLESLGIADTVKPGTQVGRLSIAEQQMVEVAKALSFESTVLVMDEPTAALSPAESEALFHRIELLVGRGVGIVYISHRLEEVFDLADRVTVLRDGEKVGTHPIAELDPRSLPRMMVGRELDTTYFPEKASPAELGEPLLELREATSAAIDGVSLRVRAGEIVGVGGLEGAGQKDLADALFGVEPLSGGEYLIDGASVSVRRPRAAIQKGIGYVTADRKGEGLVMPLSILDNALLTVRAFGARGGESRRRVQELLDGMSIRAQGLDQQVQLLSGGNQQKVVLARWLAANARILILHEPTRGVDIGAKAAIHNLLRGLAKEGRALLLISSDLPELMGMSDRIVVMRDRTVAGELAGDASDAEVMAVATATHEGVTDVV